MSKNNNFNNLILYFFEKINFSWLKNRRLKRKHNKNHILIIKDEKLVLSDIFDCPENYKKILNILIERKMCHPDTGLWIDYGKGYKSFMIAFIKSLHTKGYCNTKYKLTNNQIQAICLNSFGIHISVDLISHVKPEDIIIKFIPTAFSLN